MRVDAAGLCLVPFLQNTHAGGCIARRWRGPPSVGGRISAGGVLRDAVAALLGLWTMSERGWRRRVARIAGIVGIVVAGAVALRPCRVPM